MPLLKFSTSLVIGTVATVFVGLVSIAQESPVPSGKSWADLMQAGEESLRAGRSQEALDFFFAAERAYPAGLPSTSETLAAKGVLHHMIAKAYIAQAKPSESLDYATRALKLYRAAGGKFLEHQLVCLASMAFSQQQLGNFSGAFRTYQDIVDVLPRWVGPIEYRVLEVWTQAAWFYGSLGMAAKAEGLLKELVRRADKEGRPGAAAIPLHELAGLYVSNERYAEAEKVIRRSLDLVQLLPRVQDDNFATRKLVLAEALRGQKRFSEAEIELQAALPVIRETRGPTARLGTGLHCLALVRAQQRHFDEAIRLDEEAGSILARWFQPSDPVILRYQYESLKILRAAGRKQEAKELEKAFKIGVNAWQAQNPSAHTLDARAFR